MWSLLIVLTVLIALYVRMSLSVFTIALALVFGLLSYFSAYTFSSKIILWLIWLVFLGLNCRFLRRHLLSRFIFSFYKKIMPKVSATEEAALVSGDVWWEGDLFQGKPQWEKLFAFPATKLTAAEQAFIDGATIELCRMIDDWKITHELGDMPEEIWSFARQHLFFGMTVPKEYGGLGFSAAAHALVVTKLYSRSVTVAVNIAVPNSLGPAELLTHYGTDAQKNYYLPRLARGEELPCFALTSPDAGSDATSITDTGIICEAEFEGKKVIGMRLNWDKRYITMCPVATILGLAFKLYDPEHLLGEEESLGITCALIPTSLPGVVHGRRHYPSSAVFQNGPTQGRDVFVPLDFIIGGRNMIGHGWRMLVECLSGGRAISLPASGVASAEICALTTGAYARVRQQFGMAIGKFEGIQESLAKIGGMTYQAMALNYLTLNGLSQGSSPAICSAISKYHCTELGRKILLHAMDIHGGKAVVLGPKNYLARAYQQIPIAITVEGANILTRNMIIFGQGAFRCHPYAHPEWQAAKTNDLKTFDRAVWGHIGFSLSNIPRSIYLSLTNGLFVLVPSHPRRRYLQKLTRFSANLALLADLSMLLLGGALKRKERISARLGDMLSDLFIASAVLKRFHDDGLPKEDLPLLDWACQDLFQHLNRTADELIRNFPIKWARPILRVFTLPMGCKTRQPSDSLEHRVAELLLTPSSTRERLARDIYIGDKHDANNLFALNEEAMRQVLETESLEKQLRRAYKKGQLKTRTLLERIDEALEQNIINAEQAEQLKQVNALRQQVIAVDDFAKEALQRKS